jgi:transposase-like protein
MSTPSMDITSFIGNLLERDDVDALRESVRVLAQAVMETEVSSQIGAAPYERSSGRVAYRNGNRTDVGTLGRHDRAQDPQGDCRRLLPLAA